MFPSPVPAAPGDDRLPPPRWLAGADGCRGGWVVALRDRLELTPARLGVIDRLENLFDGTVGWPVPDVLAIDMPIGLPDRITGSGRGPEQLVRPLLGARQSSVFAIPARAAVEADKGPYASQADMLAAHRAASALARTRSDPPRGVSIQAFNLFPKIRELDRLLRGDLALARRVVECHPEVAFQALNGHRPLDEPKKSGGRAHGPGLALRRQLLHARGLPDALLTAPTPRGAGEDDVVDALACLVVAAAIADGTARSYPSPPKHDAHGLPIAIWTLAGAEGTPSP